MIMLLSCFSYTMNEYKIKSQFCHLQLFLQYPQDRTQHYNQSFQHQIFKMIYAKIRSLYICSYLQFIDPFIHLGLLIQQLHFPHITPENISVPFVYRTTAFSESTKSYVLTSQIVHNVAYCLHILFVCGLDLDLMLSVRLSVAHV